jgi:hypothetical protein
VKRNQLPAKRAFQSEIFFLSRMEASMLAPVLRFVFLLVALCFVAIGTTCAQDSLNVARAIELDDAWSFTSDVELRMPYAFVATEGTGVHILDLTNPAQPIEAARCLDEEIVTDLDLYGDYLYVGCRNYGVRIVNISDPVHPQVEGGVPIFFGCMSVIADSAYLFALDGFNCEVFDRTDPLLPELLSEIVLDFTSATSVVRADTILYVSSDYSGLHVFDFTDPTQPVPCSENASDGTYFGPILLRDSLIYATSNHHGLVTMVRDSACGVGGILGFINTGVVPCNVERRDSILSCAIGNAGLWNVDIHNPRAPTLLGACVGYSSTKSVALADTLACLADHWGGIQTIDNANPRSPTQLARYEKAGFYWGANTFGDLAFATDWEAGIHIYDIHNPAAPLEVGLLPLLEKMVFAVLDSDSVLYTAGGEGLLTADLRDPTHPVVLGVCNLPGTYWIEIHDTLAYLACGGAGLKVVSVANPQAPYLVGQYETSGHGSLMCVTVRDTLAYLAYTSDHLRIVNVSNPASPVAVGAADTVEVSPIQCALRGDYLYCADLSDHFVIVDVSNPLVPFRAGSSNIIGYQNVYAIRVTGEIAVTATKQGLNVFSIADPANPVLTGYFFDTHHEFSDVALSSDGGYAYVPRYNHFTVFDCRAALLPISDLRSGLPQDLTLHEPYPNPFNPNTLLVIDLPRFATVRLTIHDVLGRQVREIVNGPLAAGTHKFHFDGSHLASGVYFARWSGDGFLRTQKLLLLK